MPLLLAAMMDTPGFLFTFLSILALTLYSAEPVRLKDWFLVDILCHGMMFGGFPFLAGFTLAGGNAIPSLQLLVVIASLCTIICCEALIAHQINDYREDMGNSYTTIVRIGQRKGRVLLAASMLFSFIVLELRVHYFGIEGYFGLGIFALLVIYPLYSCSDDVVIQTKNVYKKCEPLISRRKWQCETMISIIIPALNEQESIGYCLRSLSEQNIDRDSYEIIVVDGGSGDRTREIAGQYADQVVSQKRSGIGGARGYSCIHRCGHASPERLAGGDRG